MSKDIHRYSDMCEYNTVDLDLIAREILKLSRSKNELEKEETIKFDSTVCWLTSDWFISANYRRPLVTFGPKAQFCAEKLISIYCSQFESLWAADNSQNKKMIGEQGV